MKAIPYHQFLKIAESVAGEFGHSFLERLVDALGTYLDASFVAITVGEGDPRSHARAILAQDDGKPIDIRYALEGTPCQHVYDGQEITVPCAVSQFFPKEEGSEGYIGLPLGTGPDGKPRGAIIVFSNNEITEPELAKTTLKVFAQRAQLELQRLDHEAERERLIGTLTDLSSRLQQGYDRAHYENTEKTKLLGLIAHDLRSPLTALMSQAELGIARSAADEAMSTRFEKIMGNADRMERLIAATLERSRAETSSLSLKRVEVDLEQLARIAVRANETHAARKSIALELTCEAADKMVFVDDALMISAIDNLISNAVKYSHPSSPVQIKVEDSDGEISIAVQDQGQGLDATDLQKVFGRFQTLSARPTGGESSTGLGLANVREIAEAHGGTVFAHSDGHGAGATFRITLPRLQKVA